LTLERIELRRQRGFSGSQIETRIDAFSEVLKERKT